MSTFQGMGPSRIDWGGDGRPIHIAHAIGMAAGVYGPFAELFKSIGRPVGLDLPGHGGSSPPSYQASFKRWDLFYDAITTYIESLDAPVVAIGHSMGGTASLVAAARRPDLFSTLILIEPGTMPPFWRPWVWLVQKLGLAMKTPYVKRAINRQSQWPDVRSAADYFSGRSPFKHWRQDFIQAYLEYGLIADENDGSVRLACDPKWEGRCLATAPTDIWQYVSRIKAPTLILYGTRSTTFLPSVVRKFRECLPTAEIRPFEDTGHFIPMERPDECAAVIIDFLDKRVFGYSVSQK